MKLLLAVVVALSSALVPATVRVGTAYGRANPHGTETRTVWLTAHYSRYTPKVIRVRPGTVVRFVVRNRDPIDHELIVGPPEVHRIHEVGRQAHHHGDVPGEVSVPAGGVATTTYTFTGRGDTVFACHLPGHYAYGMRGLVRVR